MLAAGAYWPPPCPLQVPGVNCSPPWYPLPVLMAQLPPDSQCATWSHSPSVAAFACPAMARPLPPMTAPVKAILATLPADAVGLRCRPLIGAIGPLYLRPRGQLSGSGWRGRPAGTAVKAAPTYPLEAASGPKSC